MATAAGLLGFFDFPVETGPGPKVLYTCPDGQKASVTVTFCNNTTDNALVQAGWALGSATAPSTGQWKFGGANGRSLEPSESDGVSFTLGPNQKVVVGSNLIGVAATCEGVVEPL